MNSKIVTFFGGFVAGVALESYFNFGFSVSALAGSLSVIFLLIYLSNRIRVRLIFTTVFLLAISLGCLRVQLSDSSNLLFLSGEGGKKVSMFATVVDFPALKNDLQELVLSFDEYEDERVLVFISRFPEYSVGDRIKYEGVISLPTNYSDFDYKMYLKKEGIYYVSRYGKAEKVDEEEIKFFSRPYLKTKIYLSRIAELIKKKIRNLFPEPDASLLEGLLLGARTGLPKSLQEDFKRVGLTHIVALSGFNVTIVATIIESFFATFFGAVTAFPFAIAGIVLFAIMGGATASVVRAALMACVLIIAKKEGRSYGAGRALFLAGFLMLVWNPYLLLYDLGFQLSFVSVLGIIYLSPIIGSLLLKIKLSGYLGEIVSVTLGAQIFTTPLILYSLGSFSLVSLPANLAVVPLIPITMALGALSVFFSFFHNYIAIPFAFIAHLLLSYEVKATEFFSGPSFSLITGISVPFWQVFLLYLVLFLFIIYMDVNVFKSRRPADVGS